jgi:hypothetical protein
MDHRVALLRSNFNLWYGVVIKGGITYHALGDNPVDALNEVKRVIKDYEQHQTLNFLISALKSDELGKHTKDPHCNRYRRMQ